MLSIKCKVIPLKSTAIAERVLQVLLNRDLPRHAAGVTPGWVCMFLEGFYGSGEDLALHLGHEDVVKGAVWALTAKPVQQSGVSEEHES